jgi:hypothetical protein
MNPAPGGHRQLWILVDVLLACYENRAAVPATGSLRRDAALTEGRDIPCRAVLRSAASIPMPRTLSAIMRSG